MFHQAISNEASWFLWSGAQRHIKYTHEVTNTECQQKYTTTVVHTPKVLLNRTNVEHSTQSGKVLFESHRETRDKALGHRSFGTQTSVDLFETTLTMQCDWGHFGGLTMWHFDRLRTTLGTTVAYTCSRAVRASVK